MSIRKSLQKEINVATANHLTRLQVGVRQFEPLQKPSPLLGVKLVQTGNPQLLDQLVLSCQRLVAGAHHQGRDCYVGLVGASFRRFRVQYLAMQPTQTLGDFVEGPLLRLAGVG